MQYNSQNRTTEKGVVGWLAILDTTVREGFLKEVALEHRPHWTAEMICMNIRENIFHAEAGGDKQLDIWPESGRSCNKREWPRSNS